MVDPVPDNQPPSDPKTRLRPTPGNPGDSEPTRPIGPPQAAADTSPRRRLQPRWIILILVGLAALALLLFLLRPPAGDQHKSPSGTEEVTDKSVPAKEPLTAPITQPETPPDQSVSAYRQRLMALAATSPPTLPDAERERRMTRLFDRFTQAVEAGNLDLPASDSATEYLLQLTALDADHPLVLQARSMLTLRYLEEARSARLADHWDEADRQLQRAIEIRLSRSYLEETPTSP